MEMEKFEFERLSYFNLGVLDGENPFGSTSCPPDMRSILKADFNWNLQFIIFLPFIYKYGGL